MGTGSGYNCVPKGVLVHMYNENIDPIAIESIPVILDYKLQADGTLKPQRGVSDFGKLEPLLSADSALNEGVYPIFRTEGKKKLYKLTAQVARFPEKTLHVTQFHSIMKDESRVVPAAFLDKADYVYMITEYGDFEGDAVQSDGIEPTECEETVYSIGLANQAAALEIWRKIGQIIETGAFQCGEPDDQGNALRIIYTELLDVLREDTEFVNRQRDSVISRYNELLFSFKPGGQLISADPLAEPEQPSGEPEELCEKRIYPDLPHGAVDLEFGLTNLGHVIFNNYIASGSYALQHRLVGVIANGIDISKVLDKKDLPHI